MNIRTFIKIVGAIFAAPLAFLRKAKAAPVIVNGIDKVKTWPPYQPRLFTKGDGYYIAVLHPDNYKSLKTIAARDKYKHEQHMIRHNRWLAKQGKDPVPVVVGECGRWA